MQTSTTSLCFLSTNRMQRLIRWASKAWVSSVLSVSPPPLPTRSITRRGIESAACPSLSTKFWNSTHITPPVTRNSGFRQQRLDFKRVGRGILTAPAFVSDLMCELEYSIAPVQYLIEFRSNGTFTVSLPLLMKLL